MTVNEMIERMQDTAYASVVYIVEGGHPYNDSPYAPRWAFTDSQ